MAAKFIRIGGRPVFISDDEHCATDTGRVPCGRKVVAWIIGPIAGPAQKATPRLRGGMAVTPKCKRHLAELQEPPSTITKKDTIIYL